MRESYGTVYLEPSDLKVGAYPVNTETFQIPQK